MMGAAFGQGVTGLAGMRGDSGRMAHPSGAAIEASFGVGTGEVHSLEAVCPLTHTSTDHIKMSCML